MKVLIVDDDADAREFLRTLMASQQHVVEVAVNGKDALQKIRNNLPDLVISDLLMPQMDGFTLCHEIRRDPSLQQIDFVVYTGTYLQPEHEQLAIALGASAFIRKPQEPDHFLQAIENLLSPSQSTESSQNDALTLAYVHTDILVSKLTKTIQKLRAEVGRRSAIESSLLESEQALRTSLIGTVVAFSRTVGVRDPFTAGHQKRVSQLAREIAQQLQLPPKQVDGLRMGAMIHDIGKIYLPAEILNKPSRLNSMEYELVKTHCQVGYDILKDVVFPWPIADIAFQHHERMNGSGYPQGLKGEAICLEARIIGVADVMEAMMSHRPYRPALAREQALAEIRRGSGSDYDGQVVEACENVFQDGSFQFTASSVALRPVLS